MTHNFKPSAGTTIYQQLEAAQRNLLTFMPIHAGRLTKVFQHPWSSSNQPQQTHHRQAAATATTASSQVPLAAHH